MNWFITIIGLLAALLFGPRVVIAWGFYLLATLIVSSYEIQHGRRRKNAAHKMLRPFTLQDAPSVILWIGTAAIISL